MVPLLTVERGFIGVGVFVLLMLAESVWPFRPLVESRARRTMINLFIATSNALLLSGLLGGLIISIYHVCELNRIGLLPRVGIVGWWNTILTVIALDGVTYAWHRAYHGIPLMWRMHRVHHSDRDLDVTTSGRFHLTEMVLSAIFRLGVIALLGASVASVVLFEIVFGVLNQLEHANLRIPEPFETWLRWIVVTPDMHRLHHSQEQAHTNSNYSTIFSCWDRLFGTYRFGEDQRALTIGLPEYAQPEAVTFGRVLAIPFGPPCVLEARAVRRWGTVLLCGGLVWQHLAAASTSNQGLVLHQRAVQVDYLVRLPRLAAETGELRVWIPLAKTSVEQEVLERTIHAPVPYTITQDPDYGNDLLHLTLRPPFPEDLAVLVGYRAILRDGVAAPQEASALSPAQRQRYQAPEGLMIIDEEIRARAQQAATGRTTLEAKVRGIYDQVVARMAYDKTAPGWGRGDTRRACLIGKGNCTDFHSLFISMARAERIPSRFKIGVMIPREPSGIIPGYHCWAEFYEEGRGWVSVDASEAWKHPAQQDHFFGSWDANRFLISVGRHLRLDPPQEGEPVNILLYPYAELNGTPFLAVDTEVRFQDLQQGGRT